jgi:teichuronic acid biosynthesis glycosyltransferase TuaG
MNTKPLISVIIPAFNAAAFIAETLQSVQAQTFTDFEVIIVDDGSTDETAAIARRFCGVDSRFFLIQQANLGVSAARNAGILQARGEWLAFLDADDVWLPEKLGRQMALFRADPGANFLFTNHFFWDGQRDLSVCYRENRPLPEGDTARRLVDCNVYGVCSIVVQRALFDRAGIFDSALDSCEDWDMWLRLSEHGIRARGIREPLVRYRRWPGSLSHQKMKMAQCDVLVLGKNLAATRRAELRPAYRCSLNFARAKLELARARRLLDATPDEVPAAIWRAWRFYPRRLKWLLWFVLAAWPKFFGGRTTVALVHRILIRKW